MGGSASAEPFYGYSGYVGGPAPYYTQSPEIHQTTTPRGGVLDFGIRTYTTGGPFWGYRAVHGRGRVVVRRSRHISVRG